MTPGTHFKRTLLALLSSLGLLALLTGCSTGPTTRMTDNAIKACGKGNVAYVDVDDHQYGCKPSEDHD